VLLLTRFSYQFISAVITRKSASKLPSEFCFLESYLNETPQIASFQGEGTLQPAFANGGFADCNAILYLLFSVLPPLLDSGAAALNQDNQHENKKNAGSNPDNRCCVHCDTPFRVFGSILPT